MNIDDNWAKEIIRWNRLYLTYVLGKFIFTQRATLLSSSECSKSYQNQTKFFYDKWNKERSLLTSYSALQVTGCNVDWAGNIVWEWRCNTKFNRCAYRAVQKLEWYSRHNVKGVNEWYWANGNGWGCMATGGLSRLATDIFHIFWKKNVCYLWKIILCFLDIMSARKRRICFFCCSFYQM